MASPVDVNKTLRDFLVADSGLNARTGTRIFAGRDTPPEGYLPATGDAVTFRVRGGVPDYEDALLQPSVQFKCYSTSEHGAGATYRALFDALQSGRNGDILYAYCEELGQALEEPGTNWLYVLTFFRVLIRNT